MKIFMLLMVALALAAPVEAQYSGRVTDGRSVIPAVQIESWSDSARIWQSTSQADGSFTLPDSIIDSARRIVFSALGYETQSIAATQLSSMPDVVLQRQPIAMPEIIATAPVRPCPNREDPVARALWRAAAARYDVNTHLRGISAAMHVQRGSVAGPEVAAPIHSWGSADFRVPAGWWPPAHAKIGSVNEFVSERGYALRLDRPSPIAEDYFYWFYPDLSGAHAHHFASAEFGDRHTLSIISQNDDHMLLGFCGTKRKVPYLEGTLYVSSDTLFERALWSITTRKPVERAGGEVVFWAVVDPASGTTTPHLLAAKGIFWRKLGGRDLYYRRMNSFLGWQISDSDWAPLLPALRVNWQVHVPEH